MTDGIGVAAIYLTYAIDDHLRGVDVVQAKPASIVALALSPFVGRMWVFPAKVVPIIDVFTENNDVRPRKGLVAIELGEQAIGRRAAGASFRSKEFDQDGARRDRGFADGSVEQKSGSERESAG
jgi:hypothetical protein